MVALTNLTYLPSGSRAVLHRHNEPAPDAVLADFEAMGVGYPRGEPFPFWPARLLPEELNSQRQSWG